MIRTLMIEDDPIFAQLLAKKIAAVAPEVELLETCGSATEALGRIDALQPQLVLLDVEMPEMNGFELLNHVPQINFDIIFITAYEAFAYKAFKYAAIDFIVKPCNNDELKQAIEKILKKQLEAVAMEKPRLTKIPLPASDGLLFIDVNDIIRCESERNYTHIHLAGKQKILVSKNLREIEDLLAGNNFFRLHHSHLVNLNHINRYVRSDGGYVVLSDSSEVVIARSRKDEFLQLINQQD
ncbi:MAG: response regulator transcription factor [Dinghuibacter sp.]|nr:response regulator transcription factor [Dinghuibacter sp.]